ncbi:ribosomal subunit 39S-domain-containing protein [Xylaria nigripes]|nr:ribosomal subunit 39S-domain-containing protein [Xylaria nigripes]
MRRITRFRRPSCLNSPATPSRNALLPSASAPARSTPCQASFSFSCAFASTSRQRTIAAAATAAAAQLRPSSVRFYSDSLQKSTTIEPTTLTQEHETALRLSNSALNAVESASEEIGKASPYAAPPPRIDAARDTEVADPTYMPATVAKGLQTVGGTTNYWNIPGNWTRAGDFVGFRPRRKIVDNLLIEAAVRRAVLEAFALRALGREDELVASWPVGMAKEKLMQILACQAKGGAYGLSFGEGEAELIAEGLRWDEGGSARRTGEALAGLKAKEVPPLRETWEPSWKSASLADQRIRFAVTKRVFQLTSHLIPDHQITDIKTVQTLLHIVQKPPKPATLTDELQRHSDLQQLSNVTVTQKRVTRGDREVALGRYKLMQAEFTKRGLPARGHGFTRKGKEISRLRGGL